MRVVHALALFPAAISMLAAPPPPQASMDTSIQVVLTGDGGIDMGSLQTMRELLCAELRKRGHRVVENPELHKVVALTEEKRTELQKGGHRVLALRVAGRLGSKVPLVLEEVGDQGEVSRSVTLTAAEVEECDVVIPRLVEALLEAKPVAETARYDTLTEGESREVRTRPGTNHFVLGMPLPLYTGSGDKAVSGVSLGWQHITKNWMLGAELVASRSGDTSLAAPIIIHGAWYPLDGAFSPYFGLGLGYMNAEHKGADFDSKVGARLSAGMEFFRLHRMRLQAGFDFYIPGGSKHATKHTFNGDYLDPVTTQEQVKGHASYLTFTTRIAF